MNPSVVIDCFPASVSKYQKGYAIVAIDVIRATTSAVTAVMAGRRCFPVATLSEAQGMKLRLGSCLLAGELNGDVPEGFDLNNSPVQLAESDDQLRPIVLLSTSGTQLMCMSAVNAPTYVACFRNYQAVADALVGRHSKIAVIGAGSRNEFREEDQMCCAWVAEELIKAGYQPENEFTGEVVERWSGAPPEACLEGNSAKYLRRTGQLHDLDFVLDHINDVDYAVVMWDSEVIPAVSACAGYSEARHHSEVAA